MYILYMYISYIIYVYMMHLLRKVFWRVTPTILHIKACLQVLEYYCICDSGISGIKPSVVLPFNWVAQLKW